MCVNKSGWFLCLQERRLHRQTTAEAPISKEASLAEEAASAMVEIEKRKRETAKEAAQMAKCLAEMKAGKTRVAEKAPAVDDKVRMNGALGCSIIRSRQYSIEVIEVGTDNFSVSLKIGEGGYGPVYKAFLDHTPVAIKVLRPDASQGRKQFEQEVFLLSFLMNTHTLLDPRKPQVVEYQKCL